MALLTPSFSLLLVRAVLWFTWVSARDFVTFLFVLPSLNRLCLHYSVMALFYYLGFIDIMALYVLFCPLISLRVSKLDSLSSTNGFLGPEGFVGAIYGCFLLSTFSPVLFSLLIVFVPRCNLLFGSVISGRSHQVTRHSTSTRPLQMVNPRSLI